MLSYFHARAVVRNNVFAGNQHAFVASYLQDHALLLNNAFFGNSRRTIGSQAAYLDVVGNIVAESEVGVSHEFIQTGRMSCNAFAGVMDVGDRVPLGEQGNLTIEKAFVDPAAGDFRPTPALVAAMVTCLGEKPDLLTWSRPEPGAYGGALGNW